MPRPRKVKPDKYLYLVEIDYAASGVTVGYSNKQGGIYDRRVGAMSKVQAALRMGVHPTHIKVMCTPANWEIDPEFQHRITGL